MRGCPFGGSVIEARRAALHARREHFALMHRRASLAGGDDMHSRAGLAGGDNMHSRAGVRVGGHLDGVRIGGDEDGRVRIGGDEDFVSCVRMGGGRKRSLYDRLGGIFAIAAVVDHFSEAVLANPMVGRNSPNKYLRDWSRNKSAARLAGLKWMRTLWVADVAGGPYKYVATRPGRCPLGLENAHKKLQISPKEFDHVAAELARTLDHFRIADPERREVLAAFSAHKPEVNNGFFLARHLQPPTFTC